MFFFLFVGLLGTAALFAFWRGGGPERAVAAMFLAAWVVSVATDTSDQMRYRTVAMIPFAIDAALMMGLLTMARVSNRRWPVVAASLQLLILLAHVARAINPYQIRFVYMVMTAIWPFLQLIVLMTGTALHWRRTATQGAEPSWRS